MKFFSFLAITAVFAFSNLLQADINENLSQNNVESKIALPTQNEQAYMLARASNVDLAVGQAILFSELYSRDIQYNETTGVFTVPTPGEYLVTFDAASPETGNVNLVVNGRITAATSLNNAVTVSLMLEANSTLALINFSISPIMVTKAFILINSIR